MFYQQQVTLVNRLYRQQFNITNNYLDFQPQVDPVTKYLRAARNGRQDEMASLLHQFANHGVQVDVCNSSGLNALHLAAKEGHLHIAKMLLDAGINIQAETKVRFIIIG